MMMITMDSMTSEREATGKPAAVPRDESQDLAQAAGEDKLIVRSVDLMKSRREIWIEHGTELYRLRITSNGKLLLTK